MPLLWDRNSIIQTIREHPERARRLWIEQGHEGAADELVREARRHGVSFRVIPRDGFVKKFKGAKSHMCLERDEVPYMDKDLFLQTIGLRPEPLLCAFDGIYDPQNLGNIVRSAACLGVDALILPKDRSCGITDAVINVSRGGTEHVSVVKVVNLARFIGEIKKRGIFCYGLDEGGTMPLWEADLRGPVCLVFGSEAGLRRLTRDRCDGILAIPTSPTFSSLNVATSTALAVYEVMRQRRIRADTSRP